MGDVETIERAKRAWRRIRRRGRTIFAEWLLIGEALSIGRAMSLKAAETDKPYGVRYHKAMAAFLQETGFCEIGDDERHKALKCFEQRDEIMAYIATLPPDRQRTINHPNYALALFRGTRGPKPNHVVEQDKRHAVARSGGYEIRPAAPEQDVVRRVGQALGASRCAAPGSDLYGLARAAIGALTIADLYALMPVKAAKPAQREIQQHELELHA